MKLHAEAAARGRRGAPRSARRASTSSSTSYASAAGARPPSRLAARAAPARRAARRHRQRRRGDRAAAAPPGRDGPRCASPTAERRCATRRPSSSTRSSRLERTLRADARRARRHGRLGPAVLPTGYVPGQAAKHLPHRPPRRARAASLLSTRSASRAIPTRRSSRRTTSPSCCAATRSSTSRDGAKALFERDRRLLEPTSIRQGFAGGGFDGGRSLPKRMAIAAGVPGADLIPDTSELFLGFTSTQKAGLGPRQIANLETLGYADLRGRRLLPQRHAHAPLAHLRGPRGVVPELRLPRARRHGVPAEAARAPTARRRCAQPPERRRDATARCGATTSASARSGTAPSIQTDLAAAARHGRRRRDGLPEGHGDPAARRLQHARQPVLLERDPARDGMGERPAAGVHFVVFNPTSDDFHRNRLAMDGVLPGGTSCSSRRAPAGRASTRCCRRRTGRTSSCRRAGTARSRSSSSSLEPLDEQDAVAAAAVVAPALGIAISSAEERLRDLVPVLRAPSSARRVASASETSTISSPCSGAMRPKRALARRGRRP